MLQIFRNWPNTTLGVICAVILSIDFLWGFAMAPPGPRPAPADSSVLDKQGRLTIDNLPSHLTHVDSIDYTLF